MIDKKQKRMKRARKVRMNMRKVGKTRLLVHKTNQHIYAQVISPCGSKVLASASSLDKELRSEIKHGGNAEAATQVGTLIAKRATKAGVKAVGFDRSGFLYHGCVKALADAARAGGVEF